MSVSGGSLSEPTVLAHTKRRLFPGDDDTYAVVDTQFASEHWLAGEPIERAVRETLAPFNRVEVGGGYPDLIGVRALESEFLAVERFGDEPPLIAVEAKGHTADGTVDTRRGIVQAHDRLHGANAAYLAAPEPAVTETDRTLARELNIGILGVDSAGSVEPLETPRVVGNRTTSAANAIRFQASAQGVADQSFGLNHPKNYLGYPLAHYADGDTASLLSRYKVVSATDAARQGAEFLDLIRVHPDRVTLTGHGREVVRFGIRRHGSVEAALEAFEDWYRSTARFIDAAPAWGQLARRIVFAYPATQLLVTELENIHADGNPTPSLPTLVEYLHVLHPAFAVELFVRGDEAARRRVLTQEGDLRSDALEDGSIYHAPTVFQLKAMLYHAGIVTERGAEPHRLDPTEDVWALCERL
ncbi:hypothetical protein HALLA_10540 [Halostagnicola larsenii XH-48]|uniref:Uncharacterized protein n=1 Tax=Halostagnicola larsenii XH-48 TaxID=797299 RepID=W0JPW7_9EURY|nr:hypothetical protein [Halostagnicola larsenii]AHF99224.1 hypothetical protein HALLA_10540 [Halostagnicola larsenii XH-48]